VTRHVCPGLRTEPLGSYLAGLGLIRLIGEQADPAATAYWSHGGLIIDTVVADLAGWLVSDYMPTPVLSPWNGGSGFGAKDKEPKRRLEALLARTTPRLSAFREAINAANRVMAIARAAGWIKPDSSGNEKITDKARIVQEFRNRCPDVLLPWVDAAVVLTGEQLYFPPLLGTGGNDGRLDFSTNYHQHLLELFDDSPRSAERSLACARDLLTASETERLDEGPVGQFDPAAAGGQGSSPFGRAVSLVNPWEYVLLTEGALMFASGPARRHQHAAGRAAIPFTVAFSPDGSESGADGEASRGEVWAPVWARPCTFPEIWQLFGEARATWNGRPAQRAVDFYAATGTLGVARGVSEFVRYGLDQRNGLAYIAVPMATVTVRAKPEVRLAARIEDWVSLVPRADVSSAVGTAVRRFEAAHLAYARDGGAQALAVMLAALTDLEQAVGRSGRTREKVPVRRPPAAGDFLAEWTKAGESPELRIAAGIASCATRPRRGDDRPIRTMRQILLPVNPHAGGHDWTKDWRGAPLVAGFGQRPLRHVLADVLVWRSHTTAHEDDSVSFRGAPTFRRGVPVPAADLHAFARGLVDEADLDSWLHACLALDWRGVSPCWVGQPGPVTPVPTLGLVHSLARGLTPANGNTDSPRLAMEPDWASRLAAGQVAAVHAEAAARLRQAGWLAAPFQQPGVTGADIAAALVPRCRSSLTAPWLLAIKIRDDVAAEKSVIPEPLAPEFAEELS
jgi:CRISPR-associated protein Csx17